MYWLRCRNFDMSQQETGALMILVFALREVCPLDFSQLPFANMCEQ